MRVTLSAGLVAVRPLESFEHAVARADALMYQAKSMGRNRVMVETPVALPDAAPGMP